MNKNKELILILDQLSVYVSSGLTLDMALEILVKEYAEPLKKSLSSIQKQVRTGLMFSACLSGIVQDPSIIGIIKQGEASGRLAESLQSAHIILEKREELKKKCISALMYPSLIGLFALVLTVGLMRGVMPQIIPLLKSLHVKLPIITRIVIHLSDGLITYGVYVCISLAVGATLYVFLYSRYGSVRNKVHWCLLNTPIVKSFILSYWHSLFLRSCGLLIESGQSVHIAYGRAASAIGCIPLRTRFEEDNNILLLGLTLSDVFRQRKHNMKSFVPALVFSGEMTGTLGKSCIKASEVLDRALDQSLKRLTSLIEPLLMIFLGATIGTVALSIMMPIYDISKVLQR
jgi:type II secretory pathway component PulF